MVCLLNKVHADGQLRSRLVYRPCRPGPDALSQRVFLLGYSSTWPRPTLVRLERVGQNEKRERRQRRRRVTEARPNDLCITSLLLLSRLSRSSSRSNFEDVSHCRAVRMHHVLCGNVYVTLDLPRIKGKKGVRGTTRAPLTRMKKGRQV